MVFTSTYADRADDIVGLFSATFTASEGAEEGTLIGRLATELLETVAPAHLRVFSALDGETLVGTIILTQLSFPLDKRQVFLLSPVAIAPEHQGQGHGQELLRFGLDSLRHEGVEIVLTYGDVNFYGKVGFAQITEETASPPLPLSHPAGWLGLPLNGAPLDPLRGPSNCVAPFNDPAYW